LDPFHVNLDLVKKDSSSIIPKLIVIFAVLSVLAIISLFFFNSPLSEKKGSPLLSRDELFTRVIEAALPEIVKLWEEGKILESESQFNCPAEILPSDQVGSAYYQCQPHFWQCYWEGGIKKETRVSVELFDKKFHVMALPVFESIKEFSAKPRFYEVIKIHSKGLKSKFGMKIELKVEEIDQLTQTVVLLDTCRDTYLPQRIYKTDEVKNVKEFLWDNFEKHIFVDKFYVSNQKVNEWRLLTNHREKIIKERSEWPKPALLNLDDQIRYCAFWGKRLLEAKIFDASTIPPTNIEDPKSYFSKKPQTYWQRDLSKTFLGLARINSDYQLTPLDCQLAEVKGCNERYFFTDSSSWTGVNFSMGYYAESFLNFLEPTKNYKVSSNKLKPSSEWHELGKRSSWKGIQKEKNPVAFRCYEEVIK